MPQDGHRAKQTPIILFYGVDTVNIP